MIISSMGRLLVLVILVVVGVWLIRRALRRAARSDESPASTSASAPKPSEELVRCAHCGVLLPRGEARQAAGALYCSEEHARLGAGR
jgi:uncharacterized protein